MKNFHYILLIFMFLFVSCEKETIEPVQTEEVSTTPVEEIRIYGKWLLLDAKMYVENIETHQKTVYDHFDANKTVSSLRYSGSIYEIEDIEQNVTTWEFHQPLNIPGNGEFILNSDTIQPYGFYVTKSNWTIVEHPLAFMNGGTQIGGSSRPIDALILDYDENVVNFYIQMTYESIDGYNSKYFNELTMIKIEEY